jgi:translation elongation factor EF-G
MRQMFDSSRMTRGQDGEEPHVDAGKTSLTERLLFAAEIIDEVGSVDDGSST